MIRPYKQLRYKFCLMYACPVIHKSIFVYYYSKTNLKGVVEGIQRGGLGFTFISTLVVSLFFIFLTQSKFTCSQFISSLFCCTPSAFAANFKIETVKGYLYKVLFFCYIRSLPEKTVNHESLFVLNWSLDSRLYTC